MKHIRVFLFPVLVLALILAGCSTVQPGGASGSGSSQSIASVQKITPEEAKKMMDEGGVTVVDVRTQQEYESGHLPGAISVPNESIGDTLPEALPDTQARLIVYCRSGVRSADASDKLVRLGYQNVFNMGGILSWPYETVSGGES